MSNLNKTDCLPGGANTGIGKCFLDIKAMIGFFLLAPGTVFSAAQLASATTLKAALDALTIVDPSLRAYPIHNIVSWTDSSSAEAKQTFQDGTVRVSNDGKYDWVGQYLKGGACLNMSLHKFNNSSFDVLFYDQNGTLYGWKVGDTLQGIPLDLLYVPKFKVDDFTNATVYAVELGFDPFYMNNELGFFAKSTNRTTWNTITGIQNVALEASRALGVINVTASTGCAGSDMHDLYATALAVVGAWVAKNALTGALITITTVTSSSTGWVLTLNTSDPDYTAGDVTISMATPIALAALQVAKYESNVITVAIPAS